MSNRVIWSLGIAGFLILGAGAFVGLFEWNWLRPSFVALGTSQSGRSFAVDRIEDEWAWRPRFRVNGVRLGNVDRSTDREMFVAERVEFVVDLPALLRGRVEFPEIKLVRPKIALERFADGRSNWSFAAGAAAEAVLPDDRREMPLIGQVAIEGGELRYRDLAAGIDIAGQLGTASGTGGDASGTVEFQGRGTLQGEPFSLRLVGGSLCSLRDGDAPYPLAVDIVAGATRARVAGTLADPIRFEGLALEVRLRGPNLATLTKLTGLPLPHTPSYDLTALLDRQAAVWTFEKLVGRMGRSDLAGRVRIDAGRPRVFVEADLASKVLDYRDVGALIGIPQAGEIADKATVEDASGRPAAAARVLPDAPLMVEPIRSVDARVKFRGAKVQAPNVPLEAVDLLLHLQDGVLTLAPLSLGIAGGRALATVEIDARQADVRTDFDVKLDGFRLERFLAAIGFPDSGRGRIDGRIRIVGKGDSVRKALAGANGNVRLTMNGGSMSNLALQLVGLDVAQALGLIAAGDRNTPIRCMVGDIVVANGVMSPRLFLLDTDDTALTVEGETNLARESLELWLLAHPKDTSLLSARSLIRIGGYFSAPTVGVELGLTSSPFSQPSGMRVFGPVD